MVLVERTSSRGAAILVYVAWGMYANVTVRSEDQVMAGVKSRNKCMWLIERHIIGSMTSIWSAFSALLSHLVGGGGI